MGVLDQKLSMVNGYSVSEALIRMIELQVLEVSGTVENIVGPNDCYQDL